MAGRVLVVRVDGREKEIGRAAGRGRGEDLGGGVPLKKKKSNKI